MTLLTGMAARAGNPETTGQAQVRRGEALYLSTCAICHGDHQEGVAAPALRGPDFVTVYSRQPLALHEFIGNLMPFDRPGSLTPQEILDVTTYLLGTNGLSVPEDGFTTESLGVPIMPPRP